MLAVPSQPGEHVIPLFFRNPLVTKAEKRVRDRALATLEFVGIADRAFIPAGSLGFGEQKVIALARALATEADIFLLDEPASGIDYRFVEVVLSSVKKMRGPGRTICIVEHNLHVVEQLADTTYFMELGRITARGTYAEITSDARLAETYFGISAVARNL